MKTVFKLFLTSLFLTFLISCATTGKKSQTGKSQSSARKVIRLETVLLKAGSTDGKLKITAQDATSLFEDALKLVDNGFCIKAVKKYKIISDEMKDPRYAAASLFNAGLCYEQMHLFESASKRYSKLARDYPESKDVNDTYFRLLHVYEKLEAWSEAKTIINKLLVRKNKLDGIEIVETLARGGEILKKNDDSEGAGAFWNEAVLLYKAKRRITSTDSPYYYAMAQFKLGEIIHGKMRAKKIPPDESLMEDALADKCRLLLHSQGRYTEAIKTRNAHWAAAAAYRIGTLYRDLFDDLLVSPPPEDLNLEEKEIYREVLKEKISNLLNKAVKQWKRTIKMAKRLKLDNEWTARAQKDLGEILKKMETN